MIVHLIRHAHAGARSKWDGDDVLRPLTEKGWAQARLLADDLDSAGIDLLWSSAYTRCLQTLEPLAERAKLPLAVHDAFTEGSPGAVALDALLAAAVKGKVVAVCSHGDVIPALVATALGRGATLEGSPSPAKAARYEVTIKKGQVRHLRHLPAPGSVA